MSSQDKQASKIPIDPESMRKHADSPDLKSETVDEGQSVGYGGNIEPLKLVSPPMTQGGAHIYGTMTTQTDYLGGQGSRIEDRESPRSFIKSNQTNDPSLSSPHTRDRRVAPFDNSLPKVTINKDRKSNDALKTEDELRNTGKVSPARSKQLEKEQAKPQKAALQPVDFLTMNSNAIMFDQRRSDLRDEMKASNKAIGGKDKSERSSIMNAGFDHTASGKGFYRVKNQSPNQSTNDSQKQQLSQLRHANLVSDDNADGQMLSNVTPANSNGPDAERLGSKRIPVNLKQNNIGRTHSPRELPRSQKGRDKSDQPEGHVGKFNQTTNSFFRRTTGTFASTNVHRNVPSTATADFTEKTRNTPFSPGVHSNKLQRGSLPNAMVTPQHQMAFGRKAASTVRGPMYPGRNKPLEQFRTLGEQTLMPNATPLMSSVVEHNSSHKSLGAILSQANTEPNVREKINIEDVRRTTDVPNTSPCVQMMGAEMRGASTQRQSLPPGKALHLPCPKHFTLTPKQKPLPPELDVGRIHLPKHIKYSSMVKDNDIEMIRQRLRRNKIFHLQYDKRLDNEEGKLLYTGIYEQNNEAHVKGNSAEIVEPQNYYAYIMEKGLAKEKIRRRGDPIDMVPKKEGTFNKKAERRNLSLDMSKLRSKQPSIFKQFQHAHQKLIDEKQTGPTIANINKYIDEFNAKTETKEYQQSFLHFRRNIEKQLEDGYKVVDENIDGHLYRQTNHLSVIEKMAQEREGKEEFKADHATSAGASMPGSKVKVPPLIRIPSQKLSMKIKKKNKQIKEELKRLAREATSREDNSVDIQGEEYTMGVISPQPSNLTPHLNPVSAVNLEYQYSQENMQKERLKDKQKRTARKLNTIHRPPEATSKASSKGRTRGKSAFQSQGGIDGYYLDGSQGHALNLNASMSPSKPKGFAFGRHMDSLASETTGFQNVTNTMMSPNEVTNNQSNYNTVNSSIIMNQQHLQSTGEQFDTVQDQFDSIIMTNNPQITQQATQQNDIGVPTLQTTVTPLGITTQPELETQMPPEKTDNQVSCMDMGTVDSLSISHLEKPKRRSSMEERASQRNAETISNVSIALENMKEKEPVPEYNIDTEYYDVVTAICNFENRLPADVAVRTHYESDLPEYEQMFGNAKLTGLAVIKANSIGSSTTPQDAQSIGSTMFDRRLGNPSPQLKQEKGPGVVQQQNQNERPRGQVHKGMSNMQANSLDKSEDVQIQDEQEVNRLKNKSEMRTDEIESKGHGSQASIQSEMRDIVPKYEMQSDDAQSIQTFMKTATSFNYTTNLKGTRKKIGPDDFKKFATSLGKDPEVLDIMEFMNAVCPQNEKEIWEMKQDNVDILGFIDSYFHFKEFQAKENIMAQMESKKRQDLVDYQLFEKPSAVRKFTENWHKNILHQAAEGVELKIKKLNRVSKSRAMQLGDELKQIRKAPLNQGRKTKEEIIAEMYAPAKIVDKDLEAKIIEDLNKKLLEKQLAKIEKEKLGKELSRQASMAESKYTSSTTLAAGTKAPNMNDRNEQIKNLIPLAAKVIRAHIGVPLFPSDLTDNTQVAGIPWKKLKLQMNTETFDQGKFLSSLSNRNMEIFQKLDAAQKEQGNLEKLERRPFNSEEDDYWIVMEMYQTYVEWLRLQRYGEAVEDEDEKDENNVEEEADEVLKLGQRTSTKNFSRISTRTKNKNKPSNKMFSGTASSKGSDSRNQLTAQTNYGGGLTNQPSSFTQNSNMTDA